MNETQLDEAVEAAGRRLAPDVDGLIARAVADGRRQVRRRRQRAAVATAAVVVIAAAGGGWWSQRPGDTVADRTVAAAGPSSGPSGAPATASSGARVRASADEIGDRLLAMLPDGTVSDVEVREDPASSAWTGSQRGVEVSLRLDGSPMRLQLMDYNRDADLVRAEWSKDPGPRPDGCEPGQEPPVVSKHLDRAVAACHQWNESTRLQACALAPACADLDAFVDYSATDEVCNYSTAYPCRELADGSWLAAGSGGDDLDSDSPFTMANRFTADGWYVYASADNEPTPVLTVDQVTAIVTSDAWFR